MLTLQPHESENLMVSHVDEGVAMDALARFAQDERMPAGEFALFPFDADWKTTRDTVVGFSVPPSEPV